MVLLEIGSIPMIVQLVRKMVGSMGSQYQSTYLNRKMDGSIVFVFFSIGFWWMVFLGIPKQSP